MTTTRISIIIYSPLYTLHPLDDEVHGDIELRPCAWCGATYFHTIHGHLSDDEQKQNNRERRCDIRRLRYRVIDSIVHINLPRSSYSGSRLDVNLWDKIQRSDVVKDALRLGASPNISLHGRTLLHRVLYNQFHLGEEIPLLLFKHGARFDHCDIVLSKTRYGSPPPPPPLPSRPFYEASALYNWVRSCPFPLSYLVHTGGIEGSPDESSVLPIYFEHLLRQRVNMVDNVDNVAETIALLLLYTCTTLFTHVYPSPLREPQTDENSLKNCKWKVGDCVYLRVASVPPYHYDSKRIFSTWENQRTLHAGVVSDRGLGWDGRPCVRIHELLCRQRETPLESVWLDSESTEIYSPDQVSLYVDDPQYRSLFTDLLDDTNERERVFQYNNPSQRYESVSVAEITLYSYLEKK